MKHLTKEQRYTISVMLQKGYSQKEIAKAIDKDKSTISREIKRNRDKRNGVYKANLAQKKYEQRQKEKPKKIYFTEEVKRYVDSKLSEDYSPEQIYNRAKLEGVNCVSWSYPTSEATAEGLNFKRPTPDNTAQSHGYQD